MSTLREKMRTRVRILPEGDIVELVFAGTVTAQGLLEAYGNLADLPGWHEGMGLLSIYEHEALLGELTAASIRELYETVGATGAFHARACRGRSATVTSDPLKAGILQVQTWSARDYPGFDKRFFNSRREAIDWLRGD